LRCRICRPWGRHGHMAGTENGGDDRGGQAGKSVCGHSVPRCATRALQREALVPSVCRRVVQVSGLGELNAEEQPTRLSGLIYNDLRRALLDRPDEGVRTYVKEGG